MQSGISGLGYVGILGLAWLLSVDRRRFPWRLVIAGSLLQFLLAVVILRTSPGQTVFRGIGRVFTALLDFVNAGSRFVFGERFEDFYFAFKVLPTIIYFSALASVLYYLGIMQLLVRAIARVLQWTLKTSAAETLSTSANIFVGQTEAPLLVKPYLGEMTRSELNAVMVGGFATIAGGVLAAFVGMGIDAGHLVTASVISAPAAMLIAKILVPETEHPATLGDVALEVPRPGTNLVEAIAIGTSDGLKLALNVAAMLIVFLALIAMVDEGVRLTGQLFGLNWSLGAGLGYVFAPLAYLMGIPARDCLQAGYLLGLKMATTEFVAYEHLARWQQADSPVRLDPRTVTILTYALCGFSNVASIGVQVGGLGELVPARRADLAQLGVRAMLGGTLACCLTACVAGTLLD